MISAPQLGLSEEQKNQAYGIYYDQSLDMTNGMIDPQQMGDSRDEAKEKILGILNDEQKAIFETMNQGQSFRNFTIMAQ